MYAVVKTGGKQYRVAAGDVICVEKLDGQPGEMVKIEDVLLLVDGEQVVVGRPIVAQAAVSAEIVEQDKHRKVIIFKYRRRKRYRRRAGHRQPYTKLKVTAIEAGGALAGATASA